MANMVVGEMDQNSGLREHFILRYDTASLGIFYCFTRFCSGADERESEKMLIEGRKNEENPKCPDGTNTPAEERGG